MGAEEDLRAGSLGRAPARDDDPRVRHGAHRPQVMRHGGREMREVAIAHVADGKITRDEFF